MLGLQRAAYAVEAELIGTHVLPPLEDTAESLSRCGETFYGYFPRGVLVGAVSYKKGEDAPDVYRLVVRPDHFRRGIGRSLMLFVEGMAGTVDRVVVSAGSENVPAKRLYKGLGFREAGERTSSGPRNHRLRETVRRR